MGPRNALGPVHIPSLSLLFGLALFLPGSSTVPECGSGGLGAWGGSSAGACCGDYPAHDLAPHESGALASRHSGLPVSFERVLRLRGGRKGGRGGSLVRAGSGPLITGKKRMDVAEFRAKQRRKQVEKKQRKEREEIAERKEIEKIFASISAMVLSCRLDDEDTQKEYVRLRAAFEEYDATCGANETRAFDELERKLCAPPPPPERRTGRTPICTRLRIPPPAPPHPVQGERLPFLHTLQVI